MQNRAVSGLSSTAGYASLTLRERPHRLHKEALYINLWVDGCYQTVETSRSYIVDSIVNVCGASTNRGLEEHSIMLHPQEATVVSKQPHMLRSRLRSNPTYWRAATVKDDVVVSS